MKASPASAEEHVQDSRLAYVLLGGVACFYGATAIWAKGWGYGGDSFGHYLISRYSWKHPELFLHNWGKPFFTLVSSPFTQLGWPGMIAFNLSCGVITAYVTYRYCRKMRIPQSWLSIVLLALMPIYFRQVPTGLTEPLFALIVALSAYLFLAEQFVAACLLVSFLPLVRTEGIGILPLFFAALLVKGHVAKAPLLATGLALYSVVGYVVKGNLFWLKSESYSYQNLTYGLKGSLLHYFKLSPYLFGVPLLPLIIVGLGWLLVTLATKRARSEDSKELIITALLMTGSLCVLFSVYVVTWGFGIFDVIGLTRPMATTAPGAVVTAMLGVRWATDRIAGRKALKGVLLAVLFSLAAVSAYRLAGRGAGLSGENAMVRNAALWLKSSGHAKEKIYYFNPIVPVELEIDPYDHNRMDRLWALRRESPAKRAIIFWDAHFGPNEARLPLTNLRKSSDLVLLKSFVPDPPFTTFRGYPFEIHIFQKSNDRESALYASD